MRALVCVKRVVDPYAKIQIKGDGSGIQDQNLKMVMNPFDEIALEEALRMRERQALEQIVVVSIGQSSSQEVLRHALALGADAAFLIQSEVELTPLERARVFAQLVQQQGCQLVWMGKQAIDDDSNQCGQMLAGLLGWPQGCFVSKVEQHAEALVVTQEVDAGLETIQIKLPCVLTADLRLNTPRYATLPNIMKARQKPLTVIPVETFLQPQPLVQIVKTQTPVARTPGKKLADLNALLAALQL